MADNTEINRSYQDNFSVKEYVSETLSDKYFPGIEESKRTVGLLGLTSETMANISEDTFNAVTVLFREMFPNRAVLKESIFSHAAIFQLSNAFATAASTKFLLVVPEDQIVANAEFENGIGYFYIEKDLTLYIEDIPFTLDYDIVIRIVKKRISQTKEDYIFSAQYDTDAYTNSISDINDPYIKLRRTANGWVGMDLDLHQCTRKTQTEKIINNTKINYPVIDVPFTGKLAGFEVLYKTPDDDDYNTQMKTRVLYSQPIKTAFCYYTLTSSQNLRISFNSKENYFQPDFNSEIKIILYITQGSAGNFEKYTGDNVSVSISNDVYQYNSTVSFVATAITDYSSTGGRNAYTLSQLQAKTVMGYRTANALTTENDLEEFFDNYTWEYGSDNEIKFVKRRDDAYERVYTGYLVIKNDDYIYHTRTFDVNMSINDMSSYNDVIYTMNPGTLMYYNGKETTYQCECGRMTSLTEGGATCPFCGGETIYTTVASSGLTFLRNEELHNTYYTEYMNLVAQAEADMEAENEEDKVLADSDDIWQIDQSTTELDNYLVGRLCSYSTWIKKKGYDDKLTIFDLTEDDVEKYSDPRDLKFLYVNPFLWRFNKNPNLFTMYNTKIDQSIVWDYIDQNEDSYVNFVTNVGRLVRKFEAAKTYTVTASVLPTVTIDTDEHPLIALGMDENGELSEVLNDRYSVSRNSLRILLIFKDSNGSRVAYTEMYPTEIDEESGAISFETTFTTDDYITSDGRLRLNSGLIYRSTDGDYYSVDIDDATVYHHYSEDDEFIETITRNDLLSIINAEDSSYSSYSNIINLSSNDYILIPCGDVDCSLLILYNMIYDEDIEGLRAVTSDETDNIYYPYDETLDGYIWTDEYSSTTDPFTFIQPLDSIRSALEFSDCTTTTTVEAYSVNYVWDYTNKEDTLFSSATCNSWEDATANPVTYNDVSYTAAAIMDSDANFEFTADHKGTLTIVSYSTLDTPIITIDDADYTLDNSGVTEIELQVGTHRITKGTANTYIYYMSFSYDVDETTTWNASPMDCVVQSVPWVAADIAIDEESMDFFFNAYMEDYNTLTGIINTKLRNASNIDVKLYNTYGTTSYFLIGEDDQSETLNTLNLAIEFDVWFTAGTDPLDAVAELRTYIKEEIETTNDQKMNSLYISNLIRKIESTYAYVDHLRFVTINGYDSTYQNVYNYVDDIDDLTKEERRKYVPELLNIDKADITLNYEVLDY